MVCDGLGESARALIRPSNLCRLLQKDGLQARGLRYSSLGGLRYGKADSYNP